MFGFVFQGYGMANDGARRGVHTHFYMDVMGRARVIALTILLIFCFCLFNSNINE